MKTMSEEEKKIYDRLRKLRDSKKGSIAQMAKEAGFNAGTLQFYFNGNRIPDALHIVKLCEEFDISADWLLGISDVNIGSKRSMMIDGEAIKKIFELFADIMEQQMKEYIAAPLMKKLIEGILEEMKDNKHVFERYFWRDEAK